jgi:hypothetical protein
MKYLGHCHEKGRADRDKWGCPKVHMVKGQWVCDCTEPCSAAKKGRTTYTYENMDFRIFPGVISRKPLSVPRNPEGYGRMEIPL